MLKTVYKYGISNLKSYHPSRSLNAVQVVRLSLLMPNVLTVLVAGYTDETPRDYHCNLGPDGRRRDADERPELCRGTVEFVASKEYMVCL